MRSASVDLCMKRQQWKLSSEQDEPTAHVINDFHHGENFTTLKVKVIHRFTNKPVFFADLKKKNVSNLSSFAVFSNSTKSNRVN